MIKVKLILIQIRLLQLSDVIPMVIAKKISTEYAQKQMRKRSKCVTTKKSAKHNRK